MKLKLILMLTKLLVMLICVLAAPVLIISSCKKDAANDLKADGTVIDSGIPAADGCGWLIHITSPDSTYSPINLPAIYQTDNLKVHITYRKLNTNISCGYHLAGTRGPAQIQLTAIKKQ